MDHPIERAPKGNPIYRYELRGKIATAGFGPLETSPWRSASTRPGSPGSFAVGNCEREDSSRHGQKLNMSIDRIVNLL